MTDRLLETELEPLGPFSLAVSAAGTSDRCRRFRGGVLRLLHETDAGLVPAEAWQRSCGTIVLRAASESGLDLLRFQLALDDDHSEFLERFAADRLLGPSTKAFRGFRPLRLATVAHSLLRALCGQLITAREAREIEARIIRRVSPRHPETGLFAPPTQERLAALAPAELCRLGLAPRRAATLVRVCRTIDLERLRTLSPPLARARLGRERTIGPWSLGVITLEGLGAYDHGLTGDLGLVKLCSVLAGRWAGEADTSALLGGFGEWAGLASLYLLRGSQHDLVPLELSHRDVELGARALRAV